jgi:hypothetical protein
MRCHGELISATLFCRKMYTFLQKEHQSWQTYDRQAAKIRLVSCYGPWEIHISTLQFTWLNHRLRRTCAVLKRRETCVTWQSRIEIEKSFVTESCTRKTYEKRHRYRNREESCQDLVVKFLERRIFSTFIEKYTSVNFFKLLLITSQYVHDNLMRNIEFKGSTILGRGDKFLAATEWQ